jgi:hypothetical protein
MFKDNHVESVNEKPVVFSYYYACTLLFTDPLLASGSGNEMTSCHRIALTATTPDECRVICPVARRRDRSAVACGPP